MSDREMMEETKKEDPVSVENAAQEDQITEVPADETISEEPAQSPEESKTTEETTVDENNTIDSAGETIIETTNSETKEEAESVVETVTTEE